VAKEGGCEAEVRMAVISTLVLLVLAGGSTQADDPGLSEILQKVGQYVASYGDKTFGIVGIEKSSQRVLLEGTESVTPRRLVAEFALIRTRAGWIGLRDVVEINGRPIEGRKNRFERVLLDMTVSAEELFRIANESARFSIGPINRDLNVPTSALFFFKPENLARFTFSRKGAKKIDGTDTIELEFKETRRPTLIMLRAGAPVPMEGSLWVVPADGTVVRTRLRLKNFADALAMPAQDAAPLTGTRTPSVGGGNYAQELESFADVQVTYKKVTEMGLWLPSEMTEQYQGPISGLKSQSAGRATTNARYSEFKTFATGALAPGKN
jgi:hypothetical protein